MIPAASTRIDANALALLCSQEAADLLVLCAAQDLPAHSDLALLPDSLRLAENVDSQVIGAATGGEPIYAYRWGTRGPRVLVYGWPHPDEPAGAVVARWLIEHSDHPALEGVQWMVIACADPSGASMSRQWADGGDMYDYVYGSLRTEHLEREVDYGFPIQGETFVMPRHRQHGRACKSAGRCVQPQLCGEVCLRLTTVVGPLPESLALAHAIDTFQPELAVGLHNCSAGGAYNFWMAAPSSDQLVIAAQISDACELPRHLGVPIDPGHAWARAWPDARKEPMLADRERSFRRKHGIADDDRRKFLGHGSFAQYLRMRLPDADYFVPEAGIFTHPDFEDTRPTTHLRQIKTRDSIGKDGTRLRETYAEHQWAWGQSQELVYTRYKADSEMAAHDETQSVPTTVGMLMIEAVSLRRQLFEEADRLWKSLPDEVREADDLYAAERRSITAPGAWVRQHMIGWARSERSQKVATSAQYADYAWRWALESCAAAGSCVSFAERHGYDQQAQPLRSMIDSVLQTLPLREVRRPAALSQLARVLARVKEVQS